MGPLPQPVDNTGAIRTIGPAPKGYNVIPALLDRIVELAHDPRVAAFFGVCLGLYILQDVVRICLRLMGAFWRGLRKKSDELRVDSG